jgi:glycosyltransferase involved in cell wall biosynthesis
MLIINIVTVCRNSVTTIDKTFESVANQNLDGIRLHYVVVDGGSTDGTLEIIQKWVDIGLVSQWSSGPDSGIYDAMNKGIDMLDVGYTVFLNSDDQLYPGALVCVKEAVANGVDYVCGQSWIVPANGKPFLQFGHPLRLAIHTMCNHQALWVKSELCRELRYSCELGLAADADFMWRLWQKSRNAVMLDLPLSIYNAGGASSNGYEKDLALVFRKNSSFLMDWMSKDHEVIDSFLIGLGQRAGHAACQRKDIILFGQILSDVSWLLQSHISIPIIYRLFLYVVRLRFIHPKISIFLVRLVGRIAKWRLRSYAWTNKKRVFATMDSNVQLSIHPAAKIGC